MVASARQLLDLLATRHSDDIFVSECKNGPTWDAQHRRLDAWAMKRSWRHPMMWGYEIKVSRSDFLNDDKWYDYLLYCNEFYFVVPDPKIIQKDELPPEAGLLVAAKTGTRLFKRKRAVRRDIEIPVELLIYVLYSRAVIKNCRVYVEDEKFEFWRNWLARKKDAWDVGRHVSKKLRHVISEQIEKVENKNRELRDQNTRLEDVANFLETLGLNPHTWLLESRIKERLELIRNGISPEIRESIDDACSRLQKLSRELDRLVS